MAKKIISIASANGWAAVYRDGHVEPLIAWALLNEELDDDAIGVPVEGLAMGSDAIPYFVEDDKEFDHYQNNVFKA